MQLADHVQRYRAHVMFVVGSLAFAALLVTLLLSAFHQPQPHDLPVGVVAPAPVARQLLATLNDRVPGGFDVRPYPAAASARTAIAHHDLDAAAVITPRGLRLLTAEAGGTGPTQAITAAFGAMAAKTGRTLTVTDVAPPLSRDAEALSPFFLLLGVMLPSIAAGTASALAFRRARPAWAAGAPVVVAAVVGLATAGIAVGLTGFGNYPAIAGIAALFSLAISAPTAFLARVRPFLTPLAVLAFIVFGIPVSGGPAGLAAFGPGYLRVLDPALPLGVAADALRNTVYFGGYHTARDLWVLAAWAGGGLIALALLTAMRRQQERPLPESAPDVPVVPAAGLPLSVGPLTPVDLVVGVDASEAARRALQWAVELLATRPGALHAVYVDHPAGSDLTGFGHQALAEDREHDASNVQAIAEKAAGQAGITWTFERRDGSAPDEILAAAKEHAAGPGTVIVTGRSGHAARHPMGSVPTRLLHHSPYPVMVIP